MAAIMADAARMAKPEIAGIAPFFIVRDVPAALAFYRTASASTSPFRARPTTKSSSASPART
jgi:hypothetical protein